MPDGVDGVSLWLRNQTAGHPHARTRRHYRAARRGGSRHRKTHLAIALGRAAVEGGHSEADLAQRERGPRSMMPPVPSLDSAAKDAQRKYLDRFTPDEIASEMQRP